MAAVEAEDANQALALRERGERCRFVIADARASDLEQIQQGRAACAKHAGCKPALLLLVSHSERRTAESLGADALITKPVRGSRLREALLSLACPAEPVAASLLGLASVVEQAECAKERASGRKVLIAEDNAVNQKVARRLVEKLGYAAEIVEDGHRAVAAARPGAYAVILMDCQMPGMDGFQATGAIRRLEGEPGLVPIVAMTANAVKGDREKCLQAGMSDYIAKPVNLAELKAVLERWYGKTHPVLPAANEAEWDPMFDSR
jgi:CheY-like chemotaxis protein